MRGVERGVVLSGLLLAGLLAACSPSERAVRDTASLVISGARVWTGDPDTLGRGGGQSRRDDLAVGPAAEVESWIGEDRKGTL